MIKYINFVLCVFLLVSCKPENNSKKNNQEQKCQIVKINVSRNLNNNKIVVKNELIDLELVEMDSVFSSRRFKVVVNKKCEVEYFIYEGNVLEKEYSDNETILLSNLTTSFLLGKQKTVYTGSAIPSVAPLKSKNGKPVTNEDYEDALRGFNGGWRKLNFYRTGKFVDTYEINFKMCDKISEYDNCTIRVRTKHNKLFLESIELENDK